MSYIGMTAARSTSPLPDPYSSVSLYTDISAATAQKRREFSQLTIILRDHNIPYKWGFPAKLVVTFQNQTTNIFTPKDYISAKLGPDHLIPPDSPHSDHLHVSRISGATPLLTPAGKFPKSSVSRHKVPLVIFDLTNLQSSTSMDVPDERNADYALYSLPREGKSAKHFIVSFFVSLHHFVSFTNFIHCATVILINFNLLALFCLLCNTIKGLLPLTPTCMPQQKA